MGTAGAEGLTYEEACRMLARGLGGKARVWVVSAPDVAAAAGMLGLDVADVAEPLGGVPLRLLDIRELARARHEGGPDGAAGACEAAAAGQTALAVDVSAISPLGCPACRLGAGVALASLDQVVGREGSGLVAVGLRREALEGRFGCEGLADRAASLPEPDAEARAALCEGLATFDRRRRKENDTAQVVATYLACHPRVKEVRYPGLRSDPSFETAAATLQNGFGPLVGLLPSGDDPLSGEPARDLCGAWMPGGEASRIEAAGQGWLRLRCGTGDAKELVMALEGLLVPCRA